MPKSFFGGSSVAYDSIYFKYTEKFQCRGRVFLLCLALQILVFETWQTVNV